MLSDRLSAAIKEYRLKTIRIDDAEALVIGENYALRFIADFDSIEVTYIERDRRSQLQVYSLRSLFAQRLKDEDSAKYGNPLGIRDRLNASRPGHPPSTPVWLK